MPGKAESALGGSNRRRAKQARFMNGTGVARKRNLSGSRTVLASLEPVPFDPLFSYLFLFCFKCKDFDIPLIGSGIRKIVLKIGSLVEVGSKYAILEGLKIQSVRMVIIPRFFHLKGHLHCPTSVKRFFIRR